MSPSKPFDRRSKYHPLHEHLKSLARDRPVALRFSDIEDILQCELPPGARSNRAWWGNSVSGHSQSRAWLLAGWRLADVRLDEEVATFTVYDRWVELGR